MVKKKVVKKKAKQEETPEAKEVAVAAEEQPESASKKGKRKRSADAPGTQAEAAQPAKRKKDSAKASQSDKPAAVESGIKESSGDNADVSRTVFIDGVPYEWTKEKLEQFFQPCGPIEDVNAAAWQDSGRLRGYAHITFGTTGAMKAALALTGSKVGKKGRYLKIEPAKGPNKSKASPSAAEVAGMTRLFVKNLPYDTNEEELGAVFKSCGKIREIRIPTSFGRVKGFAYIEFAKSKSLQDAVSLTPAPAIRGRQLVLDCDSGSGPKSGFHYRPEAFQSSYGPKGQKGGGKQDEAQPQKSKTKLSLF
mmetsp:Transcript_52716/g.123275  ORF Transcript_52716/g.123275 Transcript_52716/m.123275 type:complete len:307 (+) Transcript_52716:124-1044(+)